MNAELARQGDEMIQQSEETRQNADQLKQGE
jgi:hypothetical protein